MSIPGYCQRLSPGEPPKPKLPFGQSPSRSSSPGALAQGHGRLLLLVVCEATGGYEQAVVTALHAAALPVTVVEPARVRAFAKACALQAQNDRIDAALERIWPPDSSHTHYSPEKPQSATLARTFTANQLQILQLIPKPLPSIAGISPCLPCAVKTLELLRQLRTHLQKIQKVNRCPCSKARLLSGGTRRSVYNRWSESVLKPPLGLLAEMPELGQTQSRAQAAARWPGSPPHCRQSGRWQWK